MIVSLVLVRFIAGLHHSGPDRPAKCDRRRFPMMTVRRRPGVAEFAEQHAVGQPTDVFANAIATRMSGVTRLLPRRCFSRPFAQPYLFSAELLEGQSDVVL